MPLPVIGAAVAAGAGALLFKLVAIAIIAALTVFVVDLQAWFMAGVEAAITTFMPDIDFSLPAWTGTWANLAYWLLSLGNVWVGLELLLAAYLTRFAIRRVS